MKIFRLTLQFAAVSAALAAGTTRLAAQTTTGNIGGRIINSAGQGVDNAQVQVVNSATGLSVGANSRTDGSYTIVGLEVGDRYRVTIRRIGFAPQTVQPVRVTLGQTTPVNFTMSTQATTLQAVTIEAAAQNALISPSQKGTATTISDTLLRKLPTLNRNFTDFVQMTPQASTNGPGLSAGGTSNRFNNIQIDGATERDLFGLGSTGQPGGQAGGKSIGAESIKEFQVLLAPYDVRVGNFAGLSVNAVTKSGTNTLTGSAYTFFRNQNFQRDQPYITDSKQNQYGFSLGGPILKDKVFFFVNPEWQSRSSPAAGAACCAPTEKDTKVTQATIDQFTQQLTARGMTDLGDGSRISNQNPLSNVFARIDVALPFNSTLVLRDNYAHAEQQVFGGTTRSTSGTTPSFQLTSNLYQFNSSKNAPVAQLRTNFSNGAYNEVIGSYTRIRDSRATPGTLQAQVTANFPGTAAYIAGTEAASQANQLDQDILELSDNFTIPVGSSHRLTFGTQNQWYKVRNLFGNNKVGTWSFGSLDSLTAGTPNRYQVAVPVTGDGAVRFKAGQFGAYVQDDWTATPNLNFSLGLRFDVPVFFTKPPQNDVVATTFNRNTSDVPSGNAQWSPRLGFNWNVTGDSKNQVRGGVGMFQGAPAYVWLSNSFQNSGGVSGFASLDCNTPAKSPAFTADAVTHPPTTCRDGTTATAGSEVDLLRKDLKFPQTMRGNLAYDRDLGHGYVASFEGIYTRFINGLFYTNLALPDAPVGTGVDGRALYRNVTGTAVLKVPGRTTVLDVKNESEDYNYNLTAQLQKRFTTNLGGSVAYTYTQSYDVQSLTSSTAGSQYRFGRIYGGDQNSIYLNHSAWETPHRILASGSYTLPTKTSITGIYSGQSGVNFAYTAQSDLNGDGQTSNDPIYIPSGTTDPNYPVFKSLTTTLNGASVTYSPADQKAAFENFITSHDCLNSQRGKIMTRNTCQTPWTNEIDVSVEQAVTTLRGQDLSVRLDIFNFGNLINKNWGRQVSSSQFNPVQLLTTNSFVTPGTTTTTTTLANAVPLVTFDPNFTPFTYQNVQSNYTMQLSFRYSF